jgi:hypothetical protein
MIKILKSLKKVPLFVPLMKPYSINIYDADGDVSKNWYIRWFFRNPDTARLERQVNIKLGCNRIKDKEKRYAYLNRLCNFLSNG